MKNKNTSRYKGTTKGSRMIMRTSLTALFITAIAFAVAAESDESRLDKIQSDMNSIMNKAGIDFSGTFRSQYLSSNLDEKSGDRSVSWTNNRQESNEFTSVDFDIKARPNEALSGRLIFRMHQNWQNFFSDVANPIFTRWISIDGNVNNIFRFNFGDFKQHYSPLTLWSPDLEIAYEPEIFAAKRREAQNEVFIGNNDRTLQGINFSMDAEVVPIFNEMHFNANMSRLRSNGSNIINGSAVADNFEKVLMDRILFGANIDLLALKGLGFGGSVLGVTDVVATYDGSIYKGDSLARKGIISALRVKPSTSMFMEEDVFSAMLDVEAAFSSNRDSAWYDRDTNTVTGKVDTVAVLDSSFGTGMALNVDLVGKVALGDAGRIKFKIGFMSNDSLFRNEMAQSPTFLGQRIMNVENDMNSGMLYTTFDALYNQVFKFAPNAAVNDWVKAPQRKTSYLTAIVSPEEIDAAQGKGFFKNTDPALQTVLPYGPATPNRVGPKGSVNVNILGGAVDASVDFAMLSEAKTELGTDKAKFTRMGGGACLDIAKFAEILNTCKVSVGYSMENMEVPFLVQKIKSNNSFLNAGLYYNFWQRFSLLGGYQQIVNDYTTPEMDLVAVILPATAEKIIQSQWALGLEYKVSETSRVVGRYGNVGVKNISGHEEADAVTGAIVDMNKDYDFSATQVELFLNVDF